MGFKLNLLFIFDVFSLLSMWYLCPSIADSSHHSPVWPKNCVHLYDRGPCFSEDMRINGTFQWRYWFDSYETLDCKRFEYGGCGGNGNNYVTSQECYEKCYDIYSVRQYQDVLKERQNSNIRRGNYNRRRRITDL